MRSPLGARTAASSLSGARWRSGVAVGVAVGVEAGAEATMNWRSTVLVSPSASVTRREMTLVPVDWNVYVARQVVAHGVWLNAPEAHSKRSVPSPVEAQPSNVVGCPVTAPVGALQIAEAGLFGAGVGVAVGVGVDVGVGVGVDVGVGVGVAVGVARVGTGPPAPYSEAPASGPLPAGRLLPS